MRVLLAFIALACVDARWGTGGGKGAAKRKIEARDQVLLEEIRATHEDITEDEMLERLAEMRVEAHAKHQHKRKAQLHAHLNSEDYYHSGGLVSDARRALLHPRSRLTIGLSRAQVNHIGQVCALILGLMAAYTAYDLLYNQKSRSMQNKQKAGKFV